MGDAASAAILFFGLAYLKAPETGWGVNPLVAAAAWAIGWVIALWYAEAYRNQGTLSATVARVAVASGMTLGAACVLLFLGGVATGFDPTLVALIVGQALLAITFRWALGPATRLDWPGTSKRYVVVVGTGAEAQAWVDRVTAHPELGVEIVARLSEDGRDLSGDGQMRIGGLRDLPEILRRHAVDEVAVCLPAHRWARGAWAVAIAREAGKAVSIPVPQTEWAQADAPSARSLRQVVSLGLDRDHRAGQAMKRAMDLSLALTALVVLSPLLIGVALILLCCEGRPVLFVQQRAGLNGRLFGTYKFRTMARDAEARLQEVAALNRITGPALQVDDDPRVTRVGKWLRKMSIDELPQLVNTVRGEMSIVGPRPAPMVEVEGYSRWHCRRLSAKPGITGLAQVEMRRYLDFDERARLDIRYVEDWSLGLDLRIMLKTIPKVLRGSGR